VAVTDKAKTPAPAAQAEPVPGHVIHRRVKRERLAYAAATAGIAIAPQFHAAWPAHAAAAATAVGTVAWLYDKASNRAGDHEGFVVTCQRCLPVLTGAGLYLTNLVNPGTPWWEIAAATAWGALMSWMAPVTRAAHLTLELPSPTPVAALAVATGQAGTYEEYLARQWDTASAAGMASGTKLTAIRQYQHGRADFEAVVVAQKGRAVPALNATALAAAFDMPEGSVRLEAVPGSGPGRRRLIATPTLADAARAQQDKMHTLWEDKVSGPTGAAPGMALTGYRVEDNRIVLRVQAPENQLIFLPQKQLARAFGMKDASLLMVETDGLGDGVISVYRNHPLIQVREATVADLTMAEDGTIQIGLRPDGRPARIPLYDPQMGAITDLLAGAPGAGKSVTLNTMLAAERISGIVSIVADAQDGMSLPEAEGRVYHFGKGIAATGATLAAANDLAKYREKISAANGWGSFEIGKPWRLVNVTLDELNRILSSEATVPRPFRKWVTGLVGDTQATGRKLGEGIRFAAQSIHLADLGDKERIRANAKNGTVWLGRVNSSTTQHMAADGVLPPGVILEPIPRYFKSVSDIDAAFEGKDVENGPITAGMANIIQGGSLFLARTFGARKENKTFPGLIALYESAPIPTLSPDEHRVFQESYAYWLQHAEDLLAGEDPDGDTDQVDEDTLAETPAAASDTGAVADRILTVLADGPMAIKDVRAALPGLAPGSVNNTMAKLHEAGRVTPLSRGVYQRTT
jgi:hypothetical protein